MLREGARSTLGGADELSSAVTADAPTPRGTNSMTKQQRRKASRKRRKASNEAQGIESWGINSRKRSRPLIQGTVSAASRPAMSGDDGERDLDDDGRGAAVGGVEIVEVTRKATGEHLGFAEEVTDGHLRPERRSSKEVFLHWRDGTTPERHRLGRWTFEVADRIVLRRTGRLADGGWASFAQQVYPGVDFETEPLFAVVFEGKHVPARPLSQPPPPPPIRELDAESREDATIPARRREGLRQRTASTPLAPREAAPASAPSSRRSLKKRMERAADQLDGFLERPPRETTAARAEVHKVAWAHFKGCLDHGRTRKRTIVRVHLCSGRSGALRAERDSNIEELRGMTIVHVYVDKNGRALGQIRKPKATTHCVVVKKLEMDILQTPSAAVAEEIRKSLFEALVTDCDVIVGRGKLPTIDTVVFDQDCHADASPRTAEDPKYYAETSAAIAIALRLVEPGTLIDAWCEYPQRYVDRYEATTGLGPPMYKFGQRCIWCVRDRDSDVAVELFASLGLPVAVNKWEKTTDGVARSCFEYGAHAADGATLSARVDLTFSAFQLQNELFHGGVLEHRSEPLTTARRAWLEMYDRYGQCRCSCYPEKKPWDHNFLSHPTEACDDCVDSYKLYNQHCIQSVIDAVTLDDVKERWAYSDRLKYPAEKSLSIPCCDSDEKWCHAKFLAVDDSTGTVKVARDDAKRTVDFISCRTLALCQPTKFLVATGASGPNAYAFSPVTSAESLLAFRGVLEAHRFSCPTIARRPE